jgi:hypothetical protein
MRSYHSEADKVRDLQEVMPYITGKVLDVGAGHDKIVPNAIGVDGRDLPGINIITTDLAMLWDTNLAGIDFDTVFSSHYLEHSEQPFYLLECWSHCLKSGGHLVLYLPEKSHYDSTENLEHLYNWSYEDFLFAFRRILCGEGKNFKGDNRNPIYELISSGTHYGQDLYSFWIVAKKI